MFAIRKTKPEKGNKYYNTPSNGGYSGCIKGSPTDKDCNVLSNCVGYANGRFAEIIGKDKIEYQLTCNAENFIERAKNKGLEISNVPTLGGIMVWAKGKAGNSDDGAGHVAVVERIDSKNQIYTSESGYGNKKPFWNSARTNSNGRWGCGSSYTFRGCIVNPAVGKDTGPEKPAINAKFKIGDEVIINGKLYRSSNATSASGSVKNKKTKITRYVECSKHPYNTTGDLGWMDESSIKSYTDKTVTYTVQKGDYLIKIGKKFNAKWTDIAKLNNIKFPYIIKVGQVLKIK